jgi:hypothetical protein
VHSLQGRNEEELGDILNAITRGYRDETREQSLERFPGSST